VKQNRAQDATEPVTRPTDQEMITVVSLEI